MKPDDDSDEWDDLTPELSDEEIEREIDSNEQTFSTDELIRMIKERKTIEE